MSREATDARALTLAAQEALAAAFPGVAFTVETGHIRRTKDQVEVILRGEVEWTHGPCVAYVQEVIHSLTAKIAGDWKLTCIRWYSPEWATEMANHHGAHVKISTYGYNRNVALLHPHNPTPDGEQALRDFRNVLDFCLAPTYRRTN